MLLNGKTALVYGAGGAVGGAVARAFAREGAHLILAGRTSAPIERTAAAIREAGGRAEVTLVDAFDARAVEAHLARSAADFGRVHGMFNSVGWDDVQGRPLTEVADAAVLLASDYARSLTATLANATCGAYVD